MRAMNVVVMAALIAIFAVMVWVVGSTSSAYARADRFSQRSRLPYGTPETRESVVALYPEWLRPPVAAEGAAA